MTEIVLYLPEDGRPCHVLACAGAFTEPVHLASVFPTWQLFSIAGLLGKTEIVLCLPEDGLPGHVLACVPTEPVHLASVLPLRELQDEEEETCFFCRACDGATVVGSSSGPRRVFFLRAPLVDPRPGSAFREKRSEGRGDEKIHAVGAAPNGRRRGHCG